MASHHLKHVDRCLNCGAATPGAYCPDCGQEAVDADVRFRDQAAYFLEEVLTVESRLPQTLGALLFRPGSLTRAYNAGQRVRFITPLKIYLLASVTFFLVLSLAPARGRAAFVRPAGDEMGLKLTFSPGPEDKVIDADAFDRWVAPGQEGHELPPFLKAHLRPMVASPGGFVSALIEMASKASLVLVPIYAMMLTVLYWRSRRFYGEHFVFSLHMHGFAYVACTLASLVGFAGSTRLANGVNSALGVGAAAYAVTAARVAYKEGLAWSALKMAIATAGYLMALIGVILLVFLATFAMS